MTAPTSRVYVDLDATSHCPAPEACAFCGAVDDLAVATADTPVGVVCLPLCGSCAEAGDLPSWPSWTAVVACVIEHCDHLGIDVDTAAAARRAECPDCQSRNTLDLGQGDRECRDCSRAFRTTGTR